MKEKTTIDYFTIDVLGVPMTWKVIPGIQYDWVMGDGNGNCILSRDGEMFKVNLSEIKTTVPSFSKEKDK